MINLEQKDLMQVSVIGVAYEINKFFIDLSGEFGLAKLADGDGAPKNMNFSIGVGYKF